MSLVVDVVGGVYLRVAIMPLSLVTCGLDDQRQATSCCGQEVISPCTNWIMD